MRLDYAKIQLYKGVRWKTRTYGQRTTRRAANCGLRTADSGLWTCKLDISFHVRIFHFSGKRGHLRKCSENAYKRLNNICFFMSAFSTLVENADTLENARKTRKNVSITFVFSCPHFLI